jgi:hypothetical protein
MIMLANAVNDDKIPEYSVVFELFGVQISLPVNRNVVGSSPTRGAKLGTAK